MYNHTEQNRCKTTVPSTITGFLPTTSHRLLMDILTFNLCYRSQYGNHQLSSSSSTINVIFHAIQIHTEIFHELQTI